MSKRKVVPNEADTVEHDTGGIKRTRITDTPEPSQTVVQSNSLFFNRLNRDIRNIIYSYLTLPPVRNADTIYTAGLILSCRQAQQEATTEGHFQAWLLIQRILRAYASAFHSAIELPASLQTAHDLARLRKLTLISEADMDLDSLKYLEPLAFLELDELRVHYTGTEGPPIDQCMNRARTILRSACAKADSERGSTSNGPWIKKQVILWDYRDPSSSTHSADSDSSSSAATKPFPSSPSAPLTLPGTKYNWKHGVLPATYHWPLGFPYFSPQNPGPTVTVAMSETGEWGW